VNGTFLDSSIWRQTQRYGARMEAEVERQQVSVERIQFPMLATIMTTARRSRWIWDVAEDVCLMVHRSWTGFTRLKTSARPPTPCILMISRLTTANAGSKRTKTTSTWGALTKLSRCYIGVRSLILQPILSGINDGCNISNFGKRACLPIGSGTVESDVKQFKQCLTGTGMRWHLDNANHMIILRSAILGHDFDDLWAKMV